MKNEVFYKEGAEFNENNQLIACKEPRSFEEKSYFQTIEMTASTAEEVANMIVRTIISIIENSSEDEKVSLEGLEYSSKEKKKRNIHILKALIKYQVVKK